MRRIRGAVFPHLIAVFPLIFPLYLFRGEFFGIPVTLPEVLLGFAVLFFIIREELWRPTWWKKHAYEWKILALLLFLIAAVLSVLIVPEVSYMADGTEFGARMRALGIFKGWIIAPMLYFFIAARYFREKPSLIPIALRSMLLGGVILASQALYQVWTGDFITPDGRVSGPFESANYLSLYLGPLVVYSFLSIKKKQEKWERNLLVLAGVICLLALYLTFSYAAWLAVIVTFFVSIVVYFRRERPRRFWPVMAVLGIAALIAIFSQVGTEKFDQFVDLSERSSSSVRLEVYDISMALIKDNPVLGIGLGQYEQMYQEVAVDVLGKVPMEWNMLHPHNIVFALWLNMGLLGLVAFAWLCVRAFGWLFEKSKRERRIAALMLMVILIHGIFDTPYFKNDLSFQFWLLMAILL